MSTWIYLSIKNSCHAETCPTCGGSGEVTVGPTNVFESNITANLTRMAKEAGIYEHIWNPAGVGITEANQLVAPIQKALELLRSDPQRFEQFSAPNGYGTYCQFVPWLEQLLARCLEYPSAEYSS